MTNLLQLFFRLGKRSGHFARVALVGIELVAIEARAVIASVETWLKYAEAIGLTVDPASA